MDTRCSLKKGRQQKSGKGDQKMENKKKTEHTFGKTFIVLLLMFVFVAFMSTHLSASGTEICDGIDNDGDGIIDEGDVIFHLDLEDAPNGPSITGLGWTNQCKESCSAFCTATTNGWHGGNEQPGYFFDSPFEGEVIAELTLRTVGFSLESNRPNQNNEVVEAEINGVIFDRTEDNCNSISCSCTVEEQTSSRNVDLTLTNNHITVREVDDSIGMKSAKATFYENICNVPVNNAPTIEFIPDQEIDENTTYQFQVVADDEDGDTLTYDLLQGPVGFSIDSNGLITGASPEFSQDTDFTIEVEVSDGKETVSELYVLTVKNVIIIQNIPPVITSTPITEVDESTPYQYQVIAEDEDNDTLMYSLTQAPSWLSIDSNGLITGTSPEVAQDTDFNVAVRVSDGEDFVDQSYTLTVKEIVITLGILSPEEGDLFSEINDIFIQVDIENEHRIEDLMYTVFSQETGFSSGTLTDLILNPTSGFFEGLFSILGQNINQSGEHTLQVDAVDDLGRTIQDTVIFCIDVDAPTTPPHFTLEVEEKRNNNNVSLEWGTSTDIPSCSSFSHYELFRDGTSLASLNITMFLDEGLDEGTYEYTLFSVDIVGHQSQNTSLIIEIEEEEDDGRSGGRSSGRLLECGPWSACIDGEKQRICTDVDTDEERIEVMECFPGFIAAEQLNIPEQQVKEKESSSFPWWIVVLVIIIAALIIILLSRI